MSASRPTSRAVGIDFGTTNSAIALTAGDGRVELVDYAGSAGVSSVFRSALCFWQDEIPAVRQLLEQRSGETRIASAKELTAIAHGLAPLGTSPDLQEWTAPADEQP